MRLEVGGSAVIKSSGIKEAALNAGLSCEFLDFL